MHREDQRWREAVHEAGHAVMAVLLGRKLTHVRLEPVPETKLTEPTVLPKKRPESSADRAHLEGEAMLALAGVSAERVLGVSGAESLAASRADLEVASAVAVLTVGRARADKAVAHHLAVVERMLVRRKEVLKALAEVLADATELSGDEVSAIVPRR